MKLISALSGAVVALFGALVSAQTSSLNDAGNGVSQNITYIPNTYIVELEPSTGASPSTLFGQNHRSKSTYQVRREFNNAKYFYGLSLTVADGDIKQADILNTRGVKNVWPVRVMPRPEPYFAAAPPAFGNGTLPHLTGDSDVNRPLKMANVDKLHKQGIKGKGVKIGIIDSGVDYLHPALGGGFGKGFKISFGHDFVGDDYTGANTPVPDNDPLATCASGGHGTHVAGIITASDPADQGFGLVGVAPEATVGMYRVFGCNGGAGDDIVMAAMQQAVEDGVDLITMSLGGLRYWEQSTPYVQFVKNIVDSGVALIAALGNEGEGGPYAVSTPGMVPDALAVGAVENEVYPTTYRAPNNIGGSLDYISLLPHLDQQPIDLFRVGSGLGVPVTDQLANGCNNDVWTAAGKAVTDGARTAALLYSDPFCYIGLYSKKLQALNITTIVYYTNDPNSQILLSEPGEPEQFNILYLTYEQSQRLVKDVSGLKPDQKYTLSFNSSEVHSSRNPAGHAVDFYSSIGPTIEMSLKPQLAAPGGNILSTFPRSGGGYAVLSGTSMATPFVAGVYALLKSQRPKLNISKYTSILQSTASPIKVQNLDILSSVGQQGAGLIDAYAAINADSQISPSQLSLRDSAKPAKQTITVKNTSKKSKKYVVSHSGASYTRTITNFTSASPNVFRRFTLTHEAVYASAQFSKSLFTLQPGASASFDVQFSPPVEQHPESEPIYSGFVRIDTDSDHYVVPYLGIPYNRYDAVYIARDTAKWVGSNAPFTSAHPFSASDMNIGNYTLFNIDGSIPDDYVLPSTGFVVVQPTNLVRLDAVPVNTTFKPTFYGFDPSIKFNVSDIDVPLLPGFVGVPTYGLLSQWGFGNAPTGIDTRAIVQWPWPNVVTSYTMTTPTLKYENGTDFTITSGAFRPLLRVQKYGTNGTRAEDFQSWLGPICNVKTA
ncbi:Minor extracellular protease Vpr-like protein [Cladobotryum mycophilum]|uniref:Minor extracellular protease Vpr-like protein n=1 Tax=Cladobotryum mycophilum TaxID=491253 RepID=A0ABR0SIT7_9HYPO